eukprot:GHVL01012095.1.p1 GENE.GHVL01012095.1~~GHVL01012095.1.p1  ORF type:complete len:554 (-),score=102.53 GHVL01012095.1:296-1957(-)
MRIANICFIVNFRFIKITNRNLCTSAIFKMSETAEISTLPTEGNAKKNEKKIAKQKKIEEEARLREARENILTDRYGLKPLIQSKERTNKKWLKISNIESSIESDDKSDDWWIRARVESIRNAGNLVFIVLRQQMSTLQAVLTKGGEKDNAMLKFVSRLPTESVVDVRGCFYKPDQPVQSCSVKNLECCVEGFFVVSKSIPELPFMMADANRPEDVSLEQGLPTVNLDTRLDNRILDLRTYLGQSIFRVQSAVCSLYRDFLSHEGFIEIHSPKLIGGASEGGSEVFYTDYFGTKACLAQSPQLFKQMALCADMDRVYEIGPVFRAENSNTPRHLCEFTSLDLEMTIKEHYFEVLDLLKDLFLSIFEGIEKRCGPELKIIREHFKLPKFESPKDVPILSFKDGIDMLIADGMTDAKHDEDIGTLAEKRLGDLVKEKYKTDFYMLIRYPMKARPFYSMPCPDDSLYCNSYDLFMRGQEIVSGAQRIHDPKLLTERASASGVDPASIQPYIDSFTLGSYPHGGAGIGLERVVMLYLGLGNVRRSSLFPRDPKRLTP